jgi:hypothetical protein
VEPHHLRERPRDPDQVVHPLEQAGLQVGVVHLVGKRPTQPGLDCSTAVRRGPRPVEAGRRPTALAGSRGSVASVASPSASRHFPLRRHLTGAAALPMRLQDGRNRRSGRPERAITFRRNPCSGSSGTGVQDRSESALRMLRNAQESYPRSGGTSLTTRGWQSQHAFLTRLV